jgi:nucleotide-binding universal stress UspA family protein
MEVYGMYRKILVPLDGSELAECALSHVKNMVKCGFGEEVTIINVIWADVPFAAMENYLVNFDIATIREKLLIESQKYLDDVKCRLDSEGINVKTESLEGNRPAEAISDYAQKNDIDLIIIATHGYTGLKKLMFGSVALEVLHNAYAPVLLVRP